MAQSTVYDVKLVYSLGGNAATGLQQVAKEADKAAKSTDALGGILAKVGAVISGGLALSKGKELFIDFNKEIENSKISLAAITRMFDKGTTFDKAMGLADEQFARYQEAAKKSTATTREFMQMHMSLAPTFAKFGVGAGAIEDIVKGSTLAAPILGERPEIFAMDVKQMLQGTVTNRDRSAVSLLAMMGEDKEKFNANTRKDVNYAIDIVQKALTSPAIKEAAERFEGSFAGVTSTLKDTIEILGAEAGMGLFKTITAEVKKWNEWLVKNKTEVEKFKEQVGRGLVDAFRVVKNSLEWVYDHREALISIATAFAALKGIQLVGAGAKSLTTSLMGTLASAGVSGMGAALPMATLVSAASSVVMALVGTGIVASLIADFVDKEHARYVKQQGSADALTDIIANQSTLTAAATLKSMGAISEYGYADPKKALAGVVAEVGDNDAAKYLADQLVERANLHLGMNLSPFWDRYKTDNVIDPTRNPLAEGTSKKPPEYKVTINRVEVASDDPDRFVAGLVDIADKALNRPTQALSAHRI
jgi:hypothetical protein